MTWVTDKAILTNALVGYALIVNNLKTTEAPETRNHKSYTLTLGKPELTQVTNNNVLSVRLVKLEMNYRQKSVAEYDSNCDDFESLMVTIKGLSPFVSFNSVTMPERWDGKAQATTASLEIYFGTRIY